MNVTQQIEAYIAAQPNQKQADLKQLHEHILKIKPKARLWFLDGKNEQGKVVSNPNIGYGLYTIKYSDGSLKDFYQVGLSANSTGISLYILGLADKTYLAKNFESTIGKASVTGYCIKFKSLASINLDVLTEAIKVGFSEKRKIL